MFQSLTINLEAARKRYEWLDGRQYLVVPAVAITEGIHTGSKGPLLYRGEQLGKNPVAWNHKPVIVYHPLSETQQGTACQPSVLESQKVGMMLNTGYGDGKLRPECWFDEEKTRRTDPRILDAINSGKTMEVSTGLYHDEGPGGVWNGQNYTAEVLNIVPDHLAILPDQIGACSVAAGGGLLRNARNVVNSPDLSYDDIKDQLRTLLKADNKPGEYTYVYIEELFPKYCICEKDDVLYKVGYKVKSGKVALDGEPEAVKRQVSYVTNSGNVTVNADVVQASPPIPDAELSSTMRLQQLQAALRTKFQSEATPGGDWSGWVVDYFGDVVVWSHNGKLFQLPYTHSNQTYTFKGEPVEVIRASTYNVPPTPNVIGTGPTSNQGKPMATPNMTTPAPTNNVIHASVGSMLSAGDPGQDGGARRNAVNTMISGGRASESDRQFLESLSEEHFQKVAMMANKGATETTPNPYDPTQVKDRSNVHTMNQVPVTTEQYIAAAPPDVRQMLQNGMAVFNQQKRVLVNQIRQHPGNKFSEKWLLDQDMPFLQGLAGLAGTPSQPTSVLNYGGQASIPMFDSEPALNTQPTNNQGGTNNAADDPDVLRVPEMTW